MFEAHFPYGITPETTSAVCFLEVPPNNIETGDQI